MTQLPAGMDQWDVIIFSLQKGGLMARAARRQWKPKIERNLANSFTEYVRKHRGEKWTSQRVVEAAQETSWPKVFVALDLLGIDQAARLAIAQQVLDNVLGKAATPAAQGVAGPPTAWQRVWKAVIFWRRA